MNSSRRLLSVSPFRVPARGFRSRGRLSVQKHDASVASRTPRPKTRTMSTITTHASLSLVSTSNAPGAVGPYSQAVRLGNLLFCSGSLGLDPSTGKMVEGGVEAQATQALKNLKAIVEEGGGELGKVVKTTVFLHNMDDFKAVNAIYAAFFGDHKPARSAVQVARLPLDALFEIEAIVSL
ncbi:Endoribonuclease L-PSP/chorismate mutase-like protein [Earliella scabrosa]|nr:Endoribonuclease L-PSP/chorismate mutase-like protein [Earliella scabrosa]